MSLLITATSIILAANITLNILALGTHPLYIFTKHYSGRANLPFPPSTPEMISPNQPSPSHFTLHIFIHHDPFIAPIFLPSLFTQTLFPNSSWLLPPVIPPPARPEVIPTPMPQELKKELWVDPRAALGRYVFPEPVSGATTLRALSSILEQEFGISQSAMAGFTIFPQWVRDGSYPPWHGRLLPFHLTLGEVSKFDVGAENEGQYTQLSPQYAPILHLVLETKSAVLKRILASTFMGDYFGDEFKYRPDMWKRVESFDNAFPNNDREPEVVTHFREWRKGIWALQYLKRQVGSQHDEEKDEVGNLIGRVRETEKRRDELRASMLVLMQQWEEGVLGIERNEVMGELRDEDVEEKMRRLLSQRTIIRQWAKTREGTETLPVERLRAAYLNTKGPNIPSSQLENIHPPPQAKGKDNGDGSVEVSSGNSPIAQEEEIEDGSSITTTSFRHPNGTLNSPDATFTITSGVLSWGQILPLYFASTLPNTNLTGNAASIPPLLPGGTIKQHVYTYKSAARNGTWKVRRYGSSWNAADPFDPSAERDDVGWVVCHGDVDAGEVVERVRAIGGGGPGSISNVNGHVDKDVLYIGRYDWSYAWHHPRNRDFESGFYSWSKAWTKGDEAIDPGDGNPQQRIAVPNPENEEQPAVKKSGYFIAMDASGFDRDFVAAYKRDCESGGRSEMGDQGRALKAVEKVFVRDGDGGKGKGKFGVFVGDLRTGYEFAWLVFSGRKCEEHGADELVAIVYDARYEVLEGLWHDVEEG